MSKNRENIASWKQSIKALFDSQVVRLDVSVPRVVGLDVFSEVFEVVWSGWIFSADKHIE